MLELELRPSGTLVITLNRPDKRNALSRALIEQLTPTIRRSEKDASVRAVVFAGSGPSFSAGVDLYEFANGSPESVRGLIVALKELCAAVRHLSKPVACAIHGHCLGGALELAACSDFRVCTADARLGMPEVFLGMPSVIDAAILGHLIGVSRARELLLTGESISGETAYQWGLANRLAPAEGVVDVAIELLSLVTRHAPEVVASQKKLHDEWLNLSYEQSVERSVDALVDAFREDCPNASPPSVCLGR